MARSRIILGVAVLGGCMPTFEDDPSRIRTDRVLAIRSDPAEAAPGQQVSLTMLTTDTSSGEPREFTWSFCNARKPLTELGPVAQECLTVANDDLDIFTPLGTGPNVSATLATDVCRTFGPLSPNTMTLDSSVGRPADPDLSGGYYQPVVLAPAVDDSQGEEPVLGMVRLLCGGAHLSQEQLVDFNQGYRPNENPEVKRGKATIDDVEHHLNWEDAAPTVDVRKGDQVTIQLGWDQCPAEPSCGDGLCTAGENATNCSDDCRDNPMGCTGAETYLVPDPTTRTVQNLVERIEVSWFATNGTFTSAITDNAEKVTKSKNTWVAPSASGAIQVWAVIRDSRRGVSWKELTFLVAD